MSGVSISRGVTGNDSTLTDISNLLNTTNSSSVASSNTTAIQAALTAGGLVQITAPGVYYVNDTLILYDRTNLVIGQGVELRARTGGSRGTSTFLMFRNSNFNSTPVTISTITAAIYGSSMVRVTVTFASAHGLVAGNFLQIKGDGADVYNGVWEVESVSSATVLSFVMSIAGGSALAPPSAAVSVASVSQTVANPGVFTTATNAFFKGQPVTITGTPPTGFLNNTTYYVIATGLTTTTCQLADSPFATTGKQVTGSSSCTIVPTIQGSPANGYISIGGGGSINGYFDAGGFVASGTWNDHAIVFRRVLEPVVDGLIFKDVRKYCVSMQDVQNPVCRNYHGDTGSDGCHIYGPAWNPLIENAYGTFGDDVAVFQPIDDNSYAPFEVGSGFDLGGNIYNGTMRNIRARHSHNSGACVIYPNGNSNAAGATNQIYAMRGTFLIDGASVQDPVVTANWTGGPSVTLGNGYTTVPGTIDTLTIRNTQIPFLQNTGGSLITINNLTLDGMTNDGFNGTNATLNVDVMTINTLTINPANITNINTNKLVLLKTVNATINTLIYNGGYFTQSGSGTFSLLSSNGGNLGTAIFNGPTLGANVKLIDESGAYVGTPTFVLNHPVGLSGYASMLSLTGSQNAIVKINGLKSIAPVTGVFNIYSYTGTLTMQVSGMDYTGTLFANLTGSNNSFTNPDGSCPVDLSKIARTAGSTAKCASGNGTIVANTMATCDATGAANSWKQISNTTLTF